MNTSGMGVCSAVLAAALAVSPVLSASASPRAQAMQPCPCDCNGDNEVVGNEVTLAWRITSAKADATECAAGVDSNSAESCLLVLANGCAPPPTPECLCDCNHDGEVTGNEVTTTINIIAGRRDLSACPNIDCDGGVPGVFPDCGTLCMNNIALGCAGE